MVRGPLPKLKIIARKIQLETQRSSLRTNTSYLVFAIGQSIEVVSDASSDIAHFTSDQGRKIKFKAGGVFHYFEKYHPHFVDSVISQSWHTDPEEREKSTVNCGHCTPNKAVFFAHADCWGIVKHHGISDTKLYQFAVQTQPLVPWRGEHPHNRLWGLSRCAKSLSSETSLGKLLTEIFRRLPPEVVQEHIVAYLHRSGADTKRRCHRVSNTAESRLRHWVDVDQYETILKAGDILFLQLAVVESQVVPVLQEIHTKADGSNFHPLRSLTPMASPPDSLEMPIEILYARVRELFGRTYISELGCDGEGNSEGLLSIQLLPGVITGLRFALGRFGLRAVRILYDDGSRSSWLGDPSGCWFGNVIGKYSQKKHQLGHIPGLELRNIHTTADVGIPASQAYFSIIL